MSTALNCISGRDEERGLARERGDRSVLPRRRFDEPQWRRADGDDTAAFGARRIQTRGDRRAELARFCLHTMGVGLRGFHGQKGSGPDMQRHLRDLDAAGADRGDKPRRKMQARGRRGHGAGASGKQALIVLPVARIGRAPAGDIGRQRHLPERFDRRVELLAGGGEAQQNFGFGMFGEDFGLERCGIVVREQDFFAWLQFLRALCKRKPVRRRNPFMQQDFDFSARLASQAVAEEAGGNDARVIDHQNVARPEHVRQVADHAILDLVLAAPTNNKHTGAIARHCRPQRDAFGRQIEIEEIDAHEMACFSVLRDARFAGSSA